MLRERIENARNLGVTRFRQDSFARGSKSWSPRHVKQGYSQLTGNVTTYKGAQASPVALAA